MSEKKTKDLAPPEREEEKPKLRDYKAEEEKAVAKEKLEYEEESDEGK